MKEKLIKLIKLEVESRETIPYYINDLQYFGGLNMKIEFEDGQPEVLIDEKESYTLDYTYYSFKEIFIRFFTLREIFKKRYYKEVIIRCGRESFTLTEEEAEDLRTFVAGEDKKKTENKISKRLEKYDRTN